MKNEFVEITLKIKKNASDEEKVKLASKFVEEMFTKLGVNVLVCATINYEGVACGWPEDGTRLFLLMSHLRDKYPEAFYDSLNMLTQTNAQNIFQIEDSKDKPLEFHKPGGFVPVKK